MDSTGLTVVGVPVDTEEFYRDIIQEVIKRMSQSSL